MLSTQNLVNITLCMFPKLAEKHFSCGKTALFRLFCCVSYLNQLESSFRTKTASFGLRFVSYENFENTKLCKLPKKVKILDRGKIS